jgi:Putative Zn-dependent protease, contains TPR repeats
MKEILKLKDVLPKDPESLNNLGVVFYHHGLYEEALKLFKTSWYKSSFKLEEAKNNLEALSKMLGINPADVPVEERKVDDIKTVETLIFMGQEEKAEILLKEIIENNPNMLEALKMALVLSKNSGKYEDTVDYARRILSISPDDIETKKLMAEALYNLGNLEEALEVLKDVVKKVDDAEAYYLMSFVYGEMGDYENAEISLKRAKEINPSLGNENVLSIYNLVSRQKRVERENVEGGVVLAKAYLNKGLVEEALREIRRVRIQNLSFKARKDYDFVKAVIHIIKGEYVEALKIAESYKDSIRQEADMLKIGAIAHFQMGNVNDAVDYLKLANADKVDDLMWLIYQLKRRAVEIPEPERDAVYTHNLSVFLLNSGKFDEVLKELKDNRPYSRLLRARAYLGKGEYKNAIREIEGLKGIDADIIRIFVMFNSEEIDTALALASELKVSPRDLKTENFLVKVPSLAYPLPIQVEFPYERFFGSSLEGVKRALSWGNIKGALRALDLGMKFGKTPEHINYLALLSSLLGKYSLASYLIANLKKKNLANQRSLEIFGTIEEIRGNGRNAIAIFGELLRSGKNEAGMHILRVLAKMGMYETAYNFYNSRKLPENNTVKFYLGEVLLGLGNLKEAERLGKELLEMGDERGNLIIGEILFKKDENKTALDYLKKVKVGYAGQKAHLLIGNIYAILGEYEEAERYWEIASKMPYDKLLSSRATRNLQNLKTFFVNLKK